MEAGVYGHVCVVTQRVGLGVGGADAQLPLPADLPPGIDQKQINFHFQLGIQLNPKWWGGEIVMFTYSSGGGRAEEMADDMKYTSLYLGV